jgi:molybdate transport system ATP-binding protein
MALNVDIEKKLSGFCLKSKFTAGDETLAILGASGCGKSMTLKCIAGVETPDSGRIVLDGNVLFDSEKKINIPARLRKTGYLFQNYALFPNMSVEQNIACGIRKSKKEKIGIVKEKIAAFYLNGLEKQYPCQLSGGQQQRVALARMLASEPRLIMLDEPLSALDSFLKWELEQEILRVKKSFRGSILFVSHSRDEVYRLCDRVVAMENGKTQEPAVKEDFFENPQTLSAALLTGCKNVSRAKKSGEHSFFAADWNMPLTASKPVPDDLRYVGFRAHFFEVMENPGEENTVECEVTNVIEDVFSIIVMTQVKGGNPDNNRSYIRYELDKQKWDGLGNHDKLYLKMPKDKLIFIR